MNGSPGAQVERRRHPRLAPEKVRVRCMSGEFDDPQGVNLARRLVNVSLGGMCVETIGRLRPGVRLSAEVRFDSFGGGLRSEAQVVWALTPKEGAAETHFAGLRFNAPELTAPVREFLEGGRGTLIMNRRRAEYEELKAKSEGRGSEAEPKKWGAGRKTIVAFLLLLFLYVVSFGLLVFVGRRESPSGIHFRYAGADSKGGGTEENLSKLYAPLYGALRKAGVDLTYDAP